MTQAPTNPIADIAIVGGGIAGAGIAREAALRGLSVVLFEKNTFGSGTSSKSSKLIHGGIRYLELSWAALLRGDLEEALKNFQFVFSALRECRTLEKIAPDLVRPVALIIPVYRRDRRGRIAIFMGALIYSLLSCLAGNFKTVRIFWSKDSILKKLPDLNPEGLRGGILIWDHQTDDRGLVQKTMASAAAKGARCIEHAEVLGQEYRFDEDVHEIRVKIQDKDKVFLSRKLINAAGPWVDKVRGLLGEAPADADALITPIAGSHIEIKKFLDTSVILQAEDGRIFFVICRGERCRAGTTEWLCPDPDAVQPPKADVDYLLRSLKEYFPSKNFDEKDILSSDAGIRPLAGAKYGQNPNLISREHEIRVGNTGIIHVLGVKLTDHRRASEEIVSHLIPSLRRFNPNIQNKSTSGRLPLS